MEICLLGDSLLARREGAPEQMISYLLRQKLPHLSIENLAVLGYNSSDLLCQVQKLRMDNSVTFIFILIGANDLAVNKQTPIEVFRANLVTLIRTFRSEGLADRLVFLTPTPVDEDKQLYRHNGLVEQYGQVIKEVCGLFDVEVLDSYVLFMQGSQNLGLSLLLEGSLDDGLYFGRLGYDLLSDILVERLKKDENTCDR